VTRAFVAVRLPAPVLDAVAGRVSGLEVPRGRITTRDQWHLTLQFLGNEADVDAVVGALVDLGGRGGRARLGAAGAFPNERRARVLWLGLVEGNALLARLALAVNARLAPLGYEAEARPYRAHVTLFRSPRPTDLRGAVAALGPAAVGPAWDVTELTVYETELRPDGARYVERARVALPG
jgi:RNA 2',3'-cyclic 3'-phosphodiesterase